MLDSLKKALGLSKTTRKQVKLPEGLMHLEEVPAKGWWN